jgi:hypothetical protein
VRNSEDIPLTVASNNYKYLDQFIIKILVNIARNSQSNVFRISHNSMKATHVFLFDEAQVLLEPQFNLEAFFRCIRTWLRKKRDGISVIGVFSGTTSAMLNYNIATDAYDVRRRFGKNFTIP